MGREIILKYDECTETCDKEKVQEIDKNLIHQDLPAHHHNTQQSHFRHNPTKKKEKFIYILTPID